MSNIDKRATELLIENGVLVADTLRHLADNEIDSDYFAICHTNENGTEIECELAITDYARQAAGVVDELVNALESAHELVELQRFKLERQAEDLHQAKSLESIHREKRIAELEAREVNLAKLSVGEVMHMSGFSRDYAEGWCSGNDNAIHEIHAAGVKVAAAAGKGE